MTATQRGLVWEALGEKPLVVTYYEDGATDAQWRDYFSMLSGLPSSALPRLLVYVQSTPPSRMLRPLIDAVRGKPWVVALVSPSTPVRFAATTFSLVLRGFKFFEPEEVQRAFEHLGSDAAEQRAARETLERWSVRFVA